MAGRKITKAQVALIDGMGEEEVFAAYLEHGSTKKLRDHLGERFDLRKEDDTHKPVSDWALYSWINANEDRKQRWQELLDYRETSWAEEVIDIADNATTETERVASLRVRAREAAARMLSNGRKAHATDQIATTLAQAWLHAVKQADIPEADWEIEEEADA